MNERFKPETDLTFSPSADHGREQTPSEEVSMNVVSHGTCEGKAADADAVDAVRRSFLALTNNQKVRLMVETPDLYFAVARVARSGALCQCGRKRWWQR